MTRRIACNFHVCWNGRDLVAIDGIRQRYQLLIKFLPYSGATAQPRSAPLWGVSRSYGHGPAELDFFLPETSHLWLYSSPSPSLQPILGETATSILIVLYTVECVSHVGSHWITVKVRTGQQVNYQISLSYFFRHVTEVMYWNDVLVTCYLYLNTELYTYIFPWYKQPLASLHFCFNWWNKNKNITFILTYDLLWGLQMVCN